MKRGSLGRDFEGNTAQRTNGNYDRPHAPEVYIELQDGNPVRFRNIWIRGTGSYR